MGRTTAMILAALAAISCGTEPGARAPSAATERPGAASRAARGEASTFTSHNASGVARTVRVGGGPVKDPDNAFFRPLGTNGRSCGTCHDPRDNMTVTPRRLQKRFAASGGTDPIFRTVDGANAPTADVSTVEARRSAYGMLLTKGLIRVGIGLDPSAEFELVAVDDPYGYASATELSLFRRPLPASNLGFLSTVMWDGRETFKDASRSTGFAPLSFDLADQANSAILGHAQGVTPLTPAQRQEIVDYETSLFTAQVTDRAAGDLDADGATGGPLALSSRPFAFGMNDPLDGGPFDPSVFTDFAAWEDSPASARASIARGEAIFNHRQFDLTGVSGLNDDLGMAVIPDKTCSTCHDTPHAGNHSVPAPLRIGTDLPRPVGGLDVSGLPVYTLRNKSTGELATTTDPGRALVTGKWKDVGRFKGPTLRGLAGRAPYFHNGSAPDLDAVVEFYDARFQLHLDAREKADLAAFLRSL